MSCIEIVGLVFEGLTAIGTVGAVIISLWLASYSLKIKSKGEILFATFYLPDPENNQNYQPKEEFVQISIINSGSRSFILSVFGANDKQTGVNFQAHPNYLHHLCTPNSYIYTETSSGNYIFDLDAFIGNFVEALGLNSISDKNELRTRLKKINFFATTNAGYKILIKYDQNFLDDWVGLTFDKITKDNNSLD